MKIKDIDINHTVETARKALKEENLSPAFRGIFELLLNVVIILFDKLNLNSSNSSKPPSSDKNRKKSSNRKPSNKKPGGQKGHNGSTLTLSDAPDEIQDIKFDRRALPVTTYPM